MDLAVLRSNPHFVDVSDADFEALAQIGDIREYAADTTLYTPHTHTDVTYLLLRGRLKRSPLLGPETEHVAIGTVVAGSAILGHHNTEAHVCTTEDTTLLAIPKEGFYRLLDNANRAAQRTLEVVAEQLVGKVRTLNKLLNELTES